MLIAQHVNSEKGVRIQFRLRWSSHMLFDERESLSMQQSHLPTSEVGARQNEAQLHSLYRVEQNH